MWEVGRQIGAEASRYGGQMGRGEFRAAAVVAAVMALAAALVAWTHHLPLRDPDGANLPTWFRLPVIVASAVALLRDDDVAEVVALPRLDGRVIKVEGLMVLDADEHRVRATAVGPGPKTASEPPKTPG